MNLETSPRKIKVCPVVLRGKAPHRDILVFRHPLAGIQLVKGTVEADESISEAALRELEEESGIKASGIQAYLGEWETGHEAQYWHFVLCDVDDQPDTWAHFTQDDGGHEFVFFWHPIHDAPTAEWHTVFVDALEEVRSRT